MMSKSTALSWILGALFVVGLATAPAHAQATRTWISGVGDDANPCSRTAPCKTWAGAIAKTVAGGEIDVLDPGGFGGLTITKSITLDGGGGQVASTLVSATAGMNINAATNDVVTIRNVRFQGLLGNGTGTAGTPGTNGIAIFQAAQVEIQNCYIFGFAQFGITATPSANLSLKVQNTTVSNNGGGIGTKPTGGALVKLVVDGSNVDENGGGIKLDGTGGGNTNAAITNTSSSLNTNNGLNAVSGGGNVNVDVIRLVAANNGGTAVTANNGSGGSAVITVGDSILSNNGTAWSNPTGTATLLSFKNNQVTGPTGTPPGTASFQ